MTMITIIPQYAEGKHKAVDGKPLCFGDAICYFQSDSSTVSK